MADGVSMNLFIVKQLLVLPPETYTPEQLLEIAPRVLELVYAARDPATFTRERGDAGPSSGPRSAEHIREPS